MIRSVTAGEAGRVRRPGWLVLAAGLAVGLAGTGCITQDDARKLVADLQESQASHPDVPPMMLTRDPIRYPASMYGQHAQGNVTLRIFIDAAGRVHPESTQVVESSAVPAFDSAAVSGVRDLQFTPAKRKGTAVAVSVLFPVYFRHPQAPPVPGDSVLHRGEHPATASGGAAGDTTRK
ncbi:MAG: energy transducer TonB [Gemmatimonadales bacterium]